MRSRFNENDVDMNGRYGGYKKKSPAPAPPRPVNSHVPYQKYPAPQPKSWEPRSRSEYTYEPPKVDPIKELEAIGRARSEVNNNNLTKSPELN